MSEDGQASTPSNGPTPMATWKVPGGPSTITPGRITEGGKLDVTGVGPIRLDPRAVEKIRRDPVLLREQGSSFMQPWGGPKYYGKAAKLPSDHRKVYLAALGGLTTVEEIAEATGLHENQVNPLLRILERRGLVEREVEGDSGDDTTPPHPGPSPPPGPPPPPLGPLPDDLADNANAVAVYNAYLNGYTTRIEIAELTGLNPVQVLTIMRILESRGIIDFEEVVL